MDIGENNSQEDSTGSEDESGTDSQEEEDFHVHSRVPTILPRSRYAGACNVQTVKDGRASIAFVGYHLPFAPAS